MEPHIPPKVELADEYLSGTDNLWQKHPKKIILVVICAIFYFLWQYRYDILDFYYEVKDAQTEQIQEESSYPINQTLDSIYQDTTQFQQDSI